MPNSAHLHLILNHFPVIGTFFVVFILGYGVFSNNDKIKKLAMFMLVFIGLITVPVFFSGDKAAGMVKGLEGVLEEHIEPHEEFAKISLIAMEITALISLLGFVLFRAVKNIPAWFGILLLVLAIAVAGMMVYTSHLGGRISHNELMQMK
ncbi:MAG: hypothetical protein MUE56_06220 [Ignavibacteria bacterium]|jgi:archaellum biogenesis protein FlaJ (TadC family)|nr:hypothetical protein [Ignavibacteria bacterium]